MVEGLGVAAEGCVLLTMEMQNYSINNLLLLIKLVGLQINSIMRERTPSLPPKSSTTW
jgi:hypothetical protein